MCIRDSHGLVCGVRRQRLEKEKLNRKAFEFEIMVHIWPQFLKLYFIHRKFHSAGQNRPTLALWSGVTIGCGQWPDRSPRARVFKFEPFQRFEARFKPLFVGPYRPDTRNRWIGR
eukprot:3801712-Rhodomonas_salina.2